MRCLLVLFTVVVFSIVPLAETQLTVIAQEATPTGAQEPTGDMFQIITTDYAPWEQVSRPRPVPQELPVGGDGTTPIVALQQYEIYFGLEFAAVPVVEDAEFMLVAVQEGTFALDLAPPPSPNKPDSAKVGPSGPGTFLVHPSDGMPIPTMNRTDPSDVKPHYVLDGDTVKDANGGECTSMCLIPAEEVVQVKQGDRIVVREGGICLWCLLNQTDPEGDEQGLLLVTPVLPIPTLLNAFSWTQAWDETAAKNETSFVSATFGGTAYLASDPVKMSWAFNPPTGCR